MSLKNYIENIPDSPAITTSSVTTLSAGFAGLVSWLGQINWVGLISVLVAITGLAANIYFSWRRNKREEELHQLKKMRSNCE